MARQLEVNLSFTADSAKAKAQIQDLQKSLNNLMKVNPSGNTEMPVTKELLKAQQAAAQLSISLKNATNVNTGKLNLTQFSSELQKSGMTLEKYRIQLSALGPEGEKTFLNLAKSVMTADSAIKNSNKLVNDLWISLKNTAKWQLSSSIVKGFMGAMSTAFGYAEDLNKSLNQIQIVTGNSAEQMARFAKQANIAAKELSTTTTAYTDASLIYYQQGLDEANVKARTDITVKAANAAGTNAEEMADYLTAVWNSYKVGSDELERYVDIMAALGAGTATSLEEISTAMEKVASVGEATGVKFEQMSSIIATVSSVTRQSAETVGTAFKTIFARMADLELEGSIEEDGVTTTLGSVSSQLASVGVNILDANGNLKDMGDVMEDLMDKWGSMNEATQQAVAIAVAGKRQYTQLLALMNNQDMYRDAMGMASGAEGTLQEQADTYAKSWEAAQKRVKAAAQGIYDSLINDDFFIDMNDGIAILLGGIEKLIDSMGGFKGVLSAIGVLSTKIFAEQMSKSIGKAAQSLYSMSSIGKQESMDARTDAYTQSKKMLLERSGGYLNREDTVDISIQENRLDLQKQFIDNADKMTQQERELYQLALDTNKAFADRALAAARNVDLAEEEVALARQRANDDIRQAFTDEGSQQVNLEDFKASYQDLISQTGELSLKMREAFSGIDISGSEGFNNIKNILDNIEVKSEDAQIQLAGLKEEVEQAAQSSGKFGNLQQKIQMLIKPIEQAREEFVDMAIGCGVSEEAAQNLAQRLIQLQNAEQRSIQENENLNKSYEQVGETTLLTSSKFEEFGQASVSLMHGTSQAIMGFSSLTSIISTLNDQDLSTFDKMQQILLSLSMGLPMLISGMGKVKESFSLVINSIEAFTSAETGAVLATTLLSAMTEAESANIDKNTLAKEINIAMEGKSKVAKLAYLILAKLGVVTWDQENKKIILNTAMKKTNIVADMALFVAEKLVAAGASETAAAIASVAISIGLVLAAIALVTLAIYGVVKGFQAIQNSTPEGKLNKVNETLKETKTAFEEASQSVEDLKSSLNSLDEAHNNLKDLTKGTVEYSQALLSANEIAGELMRTHKSLALNASIDEDGLITFNEKGIKEATKTAGLHQAVAQTAILSAQQDANKLQIQIEKRNLNAAFSDTAKLKGEVGPGYAKNQKAIIENLIDSYLEQGAATFTDDVLNQLDINSQTNRDLIKGNTELQDSIRSMASLEKEANILRDSQNSTMAQLNNTILGIKNEDYINSEAYKNLFEENKKKADDFDWQYSKNYKEKNLEDWSFVQDFIKAEFGDDPSASYYAQQKGKMVIAIEGEENKEFTEDYVKNKVATYRASEDYQKNIQQQVESDLVSVIAGITIPEENSGQWIISTERQKEIEDIRSQIYSQIINFSDEDKNVLINNKDILDFVTKNTTSGENFDISSLQELSNILQNGGSTSEIKQLGEAFEISADKINDFILKIKEASSSIPNLQTISDAIKNLSTGEDLEDDQIEALKKLEAEYPILAQIQDRTSREYLDKLREIKEELNNLNFQKVADEYNEALENFENIDINVDDKDFYDKLDDLLSADYSLTVAIETNIKQAVDEIESSTDGIEDAISKISDGFKVAAEDVSELERVFPGITEQYSITAEGMVQLNSQIAQSAIQSAKDEVFARKQSVLAQIDAEIAYLQTKQGIYQAMAEAFQALAISDVDAEEAKIQAETILQDGYVQINDANQTRINQITEAGGSINVDNAKQATDGEIEQLEVLTSNTARAYSEVTKASAEAAKTRIANAVAVAQAEKTGEDTSKSVSSKNIQQGFKAETKSAKEISTKNISEVIDPYSGKNVQDIIENLTSSKDFKQDLANVSTAYQNAANLLGNEIGELRGYRAQVEGFDKELQYATNNAGTGGKPEKEKKDKSSSSPEKADLENLDEAITRYKNIDNQLSSIENHLDKISHKKEQAYGKKYIAALDEENEALQKQIDLHKQSQQDAIKYQQQDKAMVASLGFNIETDEFGYVTNEEQFERWVTENKNRIETNYANSVNALGEDSDNQKNALQSQKDAELERIELAETYFNLYSEATERRYEDESAIEEALSQIRENNFDKINHAYEVQADLLEREEKQVERLRKTFREGLFGLADNTDADNSLIGKNLKQLDKIEDKKKALDEAFATGAISESQYVEGLKNVDDEAGDVYDSIIELSDAIGDRFIEALNEADDIMDKSISKFNHLRTIMNSVENLIKLTYGEEDFDALGDVYENIAYASEKELKYNKEMFEERKKTMDEARRQYNEALAGNIPEGKTLDQLKENLDEAENSVRDWQEKMYASAEEFAEAINKVYTNNINKAIKQLESDLTSGSSIDELKKQIEFLQKDEELWLTGVNQQYETQKLIRTATNALESTSNKMAKEKLNLFIKETKSLQEKGKLSKYELEIQQKKYEIALAEIALQEAQNNKSQVRLQRDSEGNFNYVYTADENKMAEAEQNLADTQNDLYNYVRENQGQFQQDMVSRTEDFLNEQQEIAEKYAYDDILLQEKLKESKERYLKDMEDLQELTNISMEASNQGYTDSFALNIEDQIASVSDIKIATREYSKDVIQSSKEMQKATTEYTSIMSQDYINVKKNADFYVEGVEKDMARTTSALDDVSAQTSYWANTMTTLLDNVAGRYNNLSNACQNAMETISGFFADTDYSLMWQNANSWAEAEYAAKTREFMVQNNIAGKGQWLANSQGGLDLDDIWNQAKVIENSDNIDEIVRASYLREAKMRNSGNRYNDQTSTLQLLKDRFGGTAEYDEIIKKLRAQGVPGFDTGGYTGEFGPEAKIGLLHEKELVLNQNDTQNLLDTIDIVDKLLNNLEHQNLLQTFDISNIQGNNNSDTLEQEVTIHAEFPNVQDRNEIEEALSNLVNTASQYANRKKR